MLMARRLVAAGVRFVSLTYGGWDHHTRIVQAMNRQMPAFDQALATLIRDLDRTGLLDRTIVMVSSEFGRTPKINKDGGRDHWPKVFSVVLAGGGIKKGYIHGASNATASEPERDPIGPEDLATTIYHQLGIVADKELMAPGNRPIEIVDGGKVVNESAGLSPARGAFDVATCSNSGPCARVVGLMGPGAVHAATPQLNSVRPPGGPAR